MSDFYIVFHNFRLFLLVLLPLLLLSPSPRWPMLTDLVMAVLMPLTHMPLTVSPLLLMLLLPLLGMLLPH